MIRFNGIELDYYGDDLFPLVIDSSLGEIQSISDRSGTASKTFKLPATAKNNKAFENAWIDGGANVISGGCTIFDEGLIIANGTLFVSNFDRALNPIEYKCNFLGSEVGLIKTLKSKTLQDLPLPKIQFSDSNIRDKTSEAQYLAFGYCFNHPQITDIPVISAKKLGLFYSIGRLIKEIFFFNGYFNTSGLFVSEFCDSDYLENKFISTFEGEGSMFNYSGDSASATTLFETGAAGSPPFLIQNVQGATFIGSGITKGTGKYTFDRACTKVRAKIDVDFNLNSDVEYARFYMAIKNGTDWRYISDEVYIYETSNHQFSTEIALAVNATDDFYFGVRFQYKAGTSAPYTGCNVKVNSLEINTDALEVDDYISIAQWLPKKTQYDFLKAFMTHFNLVMDVDINGVVYLDCRNNPTLLPAYTPINGIMTGTYDITPLTSEAHEVEIEVSKNRYVSFEQDTQSVGTLASKPIQQYKKPLSKLVDLGDTFLEGSTAYSSPFKLFFSVFDFTFLIGAGSENQVEISDSWDMFLGELAGFTLYETSTQTYVNDDTSTTSLDVMFSNVFGVQMANVADYFFAKTIEQLQGKRVISCTLKVNRMQAAQVNFRNKLILNNQYYQLNKSSYDVDNRLIKAEIILL